MEYDLSRKPGDRVVKLDVLCTWCRVPSYEPLRMDELYRVILPSFLASGGDGFQMIKDEMLKHDSGKPQCPFLSLSSEVVFRNNIPVCMCVHATSTLSIHPFMNT